MAGAWVRASGGSGPDQAEDDLAVFGVDGDAARAWLGGEAEGDGGDDDAIPVLPAAWPAVELFLALSTQWRSAGMAGVRVGIDYAAIEPTLRLTGREGSPELFADLQVMEGAALEEMASRR